MDMDSASLELIGKQQQKIYELHAHIEKKSKLLNILYQDNINKLPGIEKAEVSITYFLFLYFQDIVIVTFPRSNSELQGEKSSRSSRKPTSGSQTPSNITSKSPKKSVRDSLNSSVRSITNINKLSSYRNFNKSELGKILPNNKTASPKRLNHSQSYSNVTSNFTRSNGYDQTIVDYYSPM